MSYSFKVIKKDGQLTIEPTVDPKYVPDGVFFVNGHEDSTIRSITIARSSPNDRGVLVQATGAGYAGPTPEPEPVAPTAESQDVSH